MTGIGWASMGLALLLAGAQARASNAYTAPLVPVAPRIDGQIDSIWSRAPWDSINVNWIGAKPTSTDFAGRYKAVWDSGRLYLLVEVVDDSLSDVYPDPLEHYWDDDAVEIFLDENKNGGDHQSNFSAWAYHVSTKGDVVDIGKDGQAHLYNDHIEVKRSSEGHRHVWELAIKVYGENYDQAAPGAPLVLRQGKVMGFSLAYCDNDGGASRRHFVGSVNTPGHLANQGYLNADCFGSLTLGSESAGASRGRRTAFRSESLLRMLREGYRTLPMAGRSFRPDGSTAPRDLAP